LWVFIVTAGGGGFPRFFTSGLSDGFGGFGSLSVSLLLRPGRLDEEALLTIPAGMPWSLMLAAELVVLDGGPDEPGRVIRLPVPLALSGRLDLGSACCPLDVTDRLRTWAEDPEDPGCEAEGTGRLGITCWLFVSPALPGLPGSMLPVADVDDESNNCFLGKPDALKLLEDWSKLGTTLFEGPAVELARSSITGKPWLEVPFSLTFFFGGFVLL
jgi:hypothetical protein